MVSAGAIGAAVSAVGSLVGALGAKSQGLAKLTITPVKVTQPQLAMDAITDQAIEVLFNPHSYTISKTVQWTPTGQPDPNIPLGAAAGAATQDRKLNAPILTFGGGGSRVLTLNLFFDVTEAIERHGKPEAIDDVRQETNKIARLTRIQRGNGAEDPPPVCMVTWGSEPKNRPIKDDFPFYGVITSLTQNFTLFRSDGRPVRADLTVMLTEFANPAQDKRLIDPELTTHLVMRGDTLSSIAAKFYRDPTAWRVIASENDLDDPLHLEIGRRLRIPKVR